MRDIVHVDAEVVRHFLPASRHVAECDERLPGQLFHPADGLVAPLGKVVEPHRERIPRVDEHRLPQAGPSHLVAYDGNPRVSVLRDPHDLEQGHERGVPRRHVLVAEVVDALTAIDPAGVPALEPVGVDGEPAGGTVAVGTVVTVHERVGDHLPYGVLRVLGNVSSSAPLDDDLRPRIPTDERHRVLDHRRHPADRRRGQRDRHAVRRADPGHDPEDHRAEPAQRELVAGDGQRRDAGPVHPASERDPEPARQIAQQEARPDAGQTAGVGRDISLSAFTRGKPGA